MAGKREVRDGKFNWRFQAGPMKQGSARAMRLGFLSHSFVWVDD